MGFLLSIFGFNPKLTFAQRTVVMLGKNPHNKSLVQQVKKELEPWFDKVGK